MRKTQLVSCFIVASLLAANQFTRAANPDHSDQPIVPPADAIARLKEGNGRFISGNVHPHEKQNSSRVSTRLPSFSVARIRVCHPKSSLMKASEICSSFA
jgi:hypothetical protein